MNGVAAAAEFSSESHAPKPSRPSCHIACTLVPHGVVCVCPLTAPQPWRVLSAVRWLLVRQLLSGDSIRFDRSRSELAWSRQAGGARRSSPTLRGTRDAMQAGRSHADPNLLGSAPGGDVGAERLLGISRPTLGRLWEAQENSDRRAKHKEDRIQHALGTWPLKSTTYHFYRTIAIDCCSAVYKFKFGSVERIAGCCRQNQNSASETVCEMRDHTLSRSLRDEFFRTVRMRCVGDCGDAPAAMRSQS
jgi:hypothetical protein